MPPKQPARKINGVTARTITAGIAAMNMGYVDGQKLDWISSVSLILEEERKIKMIGGGVIDTFFFHSRISLVILKQTKKISGNSSHHFVP